MAKLIKLKQVFSDSGQNSINGILQGVRYDLFTKAKEKTTKVNLVQIERILNDIFYPKGGITSGSLAEQFQNQIIAETEKTLESVYHNFNLQTSAIKQNVHAEKTVSSGRLQAVIQETQNSLLTLQNVIKTQAKSPQSIGILMNLEQQILALITKAKNFYQQYQYEFTKTGSLRQFYAQGSVGEQAVQLLKEMTAFNSATNNGNIISPTVLGDMFEQALQKAFSNYYTNATDEVVNNLIAQITGANYITRGDFNGIALNAITFNVSKDTMSSTKAKELGFRINSGNATYTYTYTPGASKQGKMDVLVEYNNGVQQDPIQQLRISAKNWIHGTRTLGETSIDAALVRSVGPNVAEYYRFAMLDSTKDQRTKGAPWVCAEAGHQLAQLALASDIVMGLNQGEKGMANILIINTGTRILVSDIGRLVTNIDDIQTNLKNYNKTKIESEALRAYDRIRSIKKDRTENYLGLITSTLDKMKVSYVLSKDLSQI